ncbi:MAG: twin-arginine translocase subunit TatB [Hyphomicrobiaceae bacterium]|nr:twin-arginine translocase subunit TatB [Hyphomicrobiaceae bacterium]
MFDIGWSELLVIAVVAIVVVGPKDLPVLMRTVGKYIAYLKRQASEFRSQFDEAMRESEIDQVRKEMEDIGRGAEESIRDFKSSVEQDFDKMSAEMDKPTPASEPTDPGIVETHGAPPAQPANGAQEAPQTTAAPSSNPIETAVKSAQQPATGESAGKSGA